MALTVDGGRTPQRSIDRIEDRGLDAPVTTGGPADGAVTSPEAGGLTTATDPSPHRAAPLDTAALRTRALTETNLANFRAWQLQSSPEVVLAEFHPVGEPGELPPDYVPPGAGEVDPANATDPVDLSAEPTELSLTDPDFQERATPGVYTDGDLTYTVMGEDARMEPFVRDREELFTETVDREAGPNSVIINGNQYDLTFGGKVGAALWDDPVRPHRTTPEGTVIADGEHLTGTPEPERFYMAYDEEAGYTFGQGEPPPGVDAAVGGLGPIIIDGQPYGVGNEYRDGVPQGAPETGPPGDAYAPFLTQRNNNTYEAFADRGDSVGKTIVAHSSATGQLMVISQQDGVAGRSLDEIRDALIAQGFDNAVFMDGSTSALLQTGDVLRTFPSASKDETNNVGIEFILP